MTAKEYLERYADAQQKKNRIDNVLSRIEAEMESCAINYNGMPRGNNISKRTEQDAIRIAEQKRKLEHAKADAIEIMCEVESTIEMLIDPMEKNVLHARYIDLKENGTPKGWWKIANNLGYSEDGVYRIHRIALEHLEKLIPKCEEQ